jgi:predicted TIM-barrel fold metal-dependent hydrolase
MRPIRLVTALLALGACAPRGRAPESGALESAVVEGAALGSAASVTDIRAIPKVDVHTHYRTDHPDLVPSLDAWHMRTVLVNVASGDRKIDEKWRDFRALSAAHAGRFFLVATFDPFRFDEPDFVPKVIAQLRADIAAGAKGVKVWKNIGMEVKDARGRYVQIDDPKFQPIWDFLAEQNIPVLAHIAEPLAAWQPLSEESPHFWYYTNNPQYHAYKHPEIPRHEEIIAARDRWLARNPRLTVVGFHAASLEHDVAEIAKRLDRYPNLYLETATRTSDFAMQPRETVRAFMLRYQDRVMWGTDFGEGSVSRAGLERSFDQHWRYYAGADTVTLGNPRGWHRTVRGLALPRGALEKFAHLNAERVLKLPPAGSR